MGFNIFTFVFGFLAFSGVIIVFQAVTAKPRQDLIAERLAQYRDHNLTLDEIELSLPFSERFIKPALERLGGLLTSRMAKNRQMVLQNKLNLAGRPYGLTVNGFEVLKVMLGVAVALIGFWFGGFVFPTNLLAKLGAAVGGFLLGRYLPDVMLNNKIKGRQKELRLALPNALDLLTISVEAGLGFDAAIGRLVEKFHNALSDEFAQVLNEIRLGRPRLEALDDMGRRSGVEELHTFIQSLIQSEQLGVGIAKVLRIQSEEMRRRRRQRAEEQAAQAPLKMLFPMIGCIFPTLFIVLMGPAVIIIIHTFQHK
ncbi:MAG TPA: type II secretion system F family protein [Candidatus Acidoferrum sp.]|nr:type II secretion system F family protein [Candidatus Acidoferrum sp.]